ncbi:MAG: hypothetical protein EPN21_14685 [Methylococcaceae bacterium]|nr:MAG: hypothetical protein EPN21_14685 [Methylococcaceae bacterium]
MTSDINAITGILDLTPELYAGAINPPISFETAQITNPTRKPHKSGHINALMLLLLFLPISGCTDHWKHMEEVRELFRVEHFSKEWPEEVQLSDGRIIEVTQKRRYEKSVHGIAAREAWLRFRLSETNFLEIEWHENLSPMRLDVLEGKPFIVAYPPTYREYVQYGRPKPAYFGFTYENSQWLRLPYANIPESQYDANLLIDNILPEGMTKMTLIDKNSKQFNNHRALGKCAKRVSEERICSWE